jgi:hypothetical protein
MLFGETVAVYCENHMECTDTLYGQNAEIVLKLLVYIVTIGLQRAELRKERNSGRPSHFSNLLSQLSLTEKATGLPFRTTS